MIHVAREKGTKTGAELTIQVPPALQRTLSAHGVALRREQAG